MVKVSLDLDDVLAGYVIGVHKVFDKELVRHNQWDPNESTGQLILQKDPELGVYNQKYLDLCEHNEDFWWKLPVITLPIEIDFEVACYITSSPENMIEVRENWLKRHGFPKAPVIHSKKKCVDMERLGVELHIDDKMSTVKEIRDRNMNALHFQPWYSTLQENKSINSFWTVKHAIGRVETSKYSIV